MAEEARAGAEVVVAESYARIFFRNCVSTYAFMPCPATFTSIQDLQLKLCDAAQGRAIPM